jgi:hypothetical protein
MRILADAFARAVKHIVCRLDLSRYPLEKEGKHGCALGSTAHLSNAQKLIRARLDFQHCTSAFFTPTTSGRDA